jgi:putative endonuclease
LARARHSHCRGRGFDSHHLHHILFGSSAFNQIYKPSLLFVNLRGEREFCDFQIFQTKTCLFEIFKGGVTKGASERVYELARADSERRRGDITQRLECLHHTQEVAGSSPAIPTILRQAQDWYPTNKPKNDMYYVYILQCDKAFFYVGFTTNLANRLLQHQRHQSSHTKRYGQVEMVYFEEYNQRADAEKREQQLKGWSKVKKKALIQNNIDQLKELSKSKS